MGNPNRNQKKTLKHYIRGTDDEVIRVLVVRNGKRSFEWQIKDSGERVSRAQMEQR